MSIKNATREKPVAFTTNTPTIYSRSLDDVSMYLVKSWIDAPVDARIFEILFVDGHLGCPSRDHRLLRLKVVGSKPLHLANPEQDIP